MHAVRFALRYELGLQALEVCFSFCISRALKRVFLSRFLCVDGFMLDMGVKHE